MAAVEQTLKRNGGKIKVKKRNFRVSPLKGKF
jgi:hypothetical protein